MASPSQTQDFRGADWELLSINCVPTEPGHVRLILRTHMSTPAAPLALRLMGLVPQWLNHLKAFDVTDGDSVLLIRQVGSSAMQLHCSRTGPPPLLHVAETIV